MIGGVDGPKSLPPVPIDVLTGFLGAGKTTLLNALLRDPRLAGTAVIVNEYGAIGIDHHLVEGVDGDMLLLATGCICCAARGDVTEALERLLASRAAGRLAFDRIVIETTGLADPGPVMNAVLLAPSVAAGSRVGALVAVVDGVFGADTLAEIEEARLQVAVADRIVFTKTELLGDAGQAATAALIARIRELNPDAPIILTAEAIASGPALFCQRAAAEQGADLGVASGGTPSLRIGLRATTTATARRPMRSAPASCGPEPSNAPRSRPFSQCFSIRPDRGCYGSRGCSPS